jgi:preprotein translocase subunit YajC
MFGITKVLAAGEQAAQVAANDAQAATAAQQTLANIGPLVMMIALFAIMYFILIRPQRKKEKEAQAMIAALAVGDKIVTIGGIWGKVVKIKDDYIFIETGNVGKPDERTVLKMERQSVKLVEKKNDSKKVESIPDTEEKEDNE